MSRYFKNTLKNKHYSSLSFESFPNTRYLVSEKVFSIETKKILTVFTLYIMRKKIIFCYKKQQEILFASDWDYNITYISGLLSKIESAPTSHCPGQKTSHPKLSHHIPIPRQWFAQVVPSQSQKKLLPGNLCIKSKHKKRNHHD